MYIREGIRSIEKLKLSAAVKRKIYSGNALKLLRLPAEKAPARRPARSAKR
jgi:predicted TIM-barrel fold metal-dependent hydrolase